LLAFPTEAQAAGGSGFCQAGLHIGGEARLTGYCVCKNPCRRQLVCPASCCGYGTSIISYCGYSVATDSPCRCT
jgi:hypothetical protein